MTAFVSLHTNDNEGFDDSLLDDLDLPPHCGSQCDRTEAAPDDEDPSTQYAQVEIANLLGVSASMARAWITELSKDIGGELPLNGATLKHLRKRQLLLSKRIPDPVVSPTKDRKTPTVDNLSRQRSRDQWVDYIAGLKPATPTEIVLSGNGTDELLDYTEDQHSRTIYAIAQLQEMGSIEQTEGVKRLAHIMASATAGTFTAEYAQVLSQQIQQGKAAVDAALGGNS